MSDNNQPIRFSRRSVISTAGGIAAIGSIPGIVSAAGTKNGRGKGNGRKDKQDDNKGGGPPSDAKNTCPDGTALLAKYEVNNGEFKFEKDSDFLEVGDAFDFTITETKEGEEVLAFEVEDASSTYDITTLSVKTGEGVFEEEGEDYFRHFDARDYDDSDPVQAISNVLLCSSVYWQADLGFGEPPAIADYNESKAELLRATLGDSTNESVSTTCDGYLSPGEENDDCTFNDIGERPSYEGVKITSEPEFDVNWNEGTITVDFNNENNRRVHLVSFERPGPFNSREEFAAQQRFDAASTTSGGPLTIDIPLPSDYE